MKHLKSYNTYNDSLVWELKRKKISPHNMPPADRQADYLATVKEEIAILLKKIYNFDKAKIDEIQQKIWLELKNEWQQILDDSLVNWDTPSICAQKCIKHLKEFLPFLEKHYDNDSN